ncbi:hypothetical protein Bca4012_044285 [Brassica carinata]|uniref:Uncharacterized protein n=1 Tax=Brassica carinata TaxID=52824 RepID=A0A8X7QTV0_BRACI|nr:hypothetical protein Bca52824_058208 [Brassica carinata]
MSVSTRSLTASPSKRTPIVAGQNKSKFVSLANGEVCEMYKREWKEGKKCFVEAAVEVVVHFEMEVCGGYGYEGDGYGGEYSGGRGSYSKEGGAGG